MQPTLKPSLEWDVKTAPISTPEYRIPQRTALLRSDNDELLGIVSSKYNFISNQSFMQLAGMIAKTGRFELVGYHEFCNGKKVMAYLREKTMINVSGFKADSYLVIGNSHDGSTRLYIGVANNIIRCQNQFYQSVGILRLSHTENIILGPVIVRNIINEYEQGNFSLNVIFERFNATALQQNAISDLLNEIYNRLPYSKTNKKYESIFESPLAKRIISSINSEVDALGKNLFGLFNGITHYTSHNAGSFQTGINGVRGHPSMVNKIAFEYCKKQLTPQ